MLAGMAAEPQVFVLVGPKGSGKTTLGRMLERQFGLHFLEVEAIARRVLADMGGVIDGAYERRVFEEIAAEVAVLAPVHGRILVETTGASDQTQRFLATLGAGQRVRLVRVRAAANTCAERIVGRDASRQVDVPIDLIRTMHARTEALSLPWELELDNDPPLTEAELQIAFAPLLDRSPA